MFQTILQYISLVCSSTVELLTYQVLSNVRNVLCSERNLYLKKLILPSRDVINAYMKLQICLHWILLWCSEFSVLPVVKELVPFKSIVTLDSYEEGLLDKNCSVVNPCFYYKGSRQNRYDGHILKTEKSKNSSKQEILLKCWIRLL